MLRTLKILPGNSCSSQDEVSPVSQRSVQMTQASDGHDSNIFWISPLDQRPVRTVVVVKERSVNEAAWQIV
jgi:hypothetical protein